MNLKPLSNRVIVKPEAAPTETESGLHLVEHWKPEEMGIVVAVGDRFCPDCQERHPPIVQPGDFVVFSWQAGQELFDHDANERYLILKDDDLIAVIEPAHA